MTQTPYLSKSFKSSFFNCSFLFCSSFSFVTCPSPGQWQPQCRFGSLLLIIQDKTQANQQGRPESMSAEELPCLGFCPRRGKWSSARSPSFSCRESASPKSEGAYISSLFVRFNLIE